MNYQFIKNQEFIMTTNYHAFLDARHEDSPIPTIRAKEILDNIASGEVLKIITSRESTVKNLRTLVANNPFNLLTHAKNEEGFVFYIEKQ